MKQEIMFFERGVYKIHTNDSMLRTKLTKWKDIRWLGTYYDKKGVCGWDYLFPSKLHDRVAHLAGLPLKKKNNNRVLAGVHSKVGTGENRYVFTKVNPSKMLYNASKTEDACNDMGHE